MDRVRSYDLIRDPDCHRMIRCSYQFNPDAPGELNIAIEGVLTGNAEYEGTLQMAKLTLYMPGCFDGSIDILLRTHGVLPKLVEFMGRTNMPTLQLQASEVLRNITTSYKLEHIRTVAGEVNVVPTLVNILEFVDSSEKLKENAAFVLCNISIVSNDVKNSILNLGILSTIGSLLAIPSKKICNMNRVVAATLASLCSWRLPAIGERAPLFEVLKQLVMSYDKDTAFHACSAVSYIANMDIESVVNNEFVPLFVSLLNGWLSLKKPVAPKLVPVLMTLANVSAANRTYPKVLIKEEVLLCLYRTIDLAEEFLSDKEFKNFKNMVIKYALRIISNVTAGYQPEIEAVIKRRIVGRLPPLLENFELDIKIEGFWAISNGLLGGSSHQVRHFLEKGCMEPLCDLLMCGDPGIVTSCLETIEGIGIRKKIDDWHQYLIAVRGVEKLKSLFRHEDSEISNKAVDIYFKYLYADDIEVVPEYNPNAFNLDVPPYVPPGGFNFEFLD